MQFFMVGHFEKKKCPSNEFFGLVGFHDPLLVSLVFFVGTSIRLGC